MNKRTRAQLRPLIFHFMKNSEFRKLQGYYQSARLDILHRRSVPSKRSAKGKAKHVGVPLKSSRIHSTSVEKLHWSSRTYKALNPNSTLVNKAS